MFKRSTITAAATIAVIGWTSVMADVKVGFLGGFTGPIESLTPPIYEGAKLAAKHVNEQGGLLDGQIINMPSGDTTCGDATAASSSADRLVNSEQGGLLDGQNIDMPSGDTTCGDATAASSSADRLVNSEHVVAIVGALCSGATIASANNAAVPGGVTMVSPASTSPALTTLADNDLVFRTAPSDSFQGEMLAKVLAGHGIKQIAITYVNNDYGKGFAEALSAAFVGSGGNVTASEAHEDGKADYRAEIGSLASSGAEILVVLAYADGSGQTIIRQALESGDFAQFVGGDGMVGDKLVAAIGADKLEGMIATKPGAPDIQGAGIFDKLAKDVGLDPQAVFAAQAYDASFLLALAIEKNGNIERAGVNQALRDVAQAPGETILPGEWKKAKALIKAGKDINYEGATGSHEFDAAGDVPGVIVEMTVSGGHFKQVGVVQ